MLFALLSLILAGCAQPKPTPPPAPRSITAGANKLGVHLLIDDGKKHWPTEVWPEHLRYARQAVGEWGYVTQLVKSNDLDSAKWQQFMDLCAQLHLTPIIRLATTFKREDGFWGAPPSAGGRYTGIAQ